MRQPQPAKPDVRIRKALHGAWWVVEVAYEGSAFTDTVGMAEHQCDALALREFTAVWMADPELFDLQREGDLICAEHAANQRWGVPADDEDAW